MIQPNAQSTVETVTIGRETALVFTIRNYGPRARYRITALAGADILKRVDPPNVEIEQSGEQRVSVWLPAGIATAGTDVELLVVATSDEQPEMSNSASQRLRVIKN